MKRKTSVILGLGLILIITSLTVIISCEKSDNPPKDVFTDDPNELQNVITIPNGYINSGNLPNSTSGSSAPVITSYQNSCSISSGYQLLLPFQYTSSNGWEYIYLQVEGATNGYFVITNPSSSTNSGTIVIPINIPKQVQNGEFSIIFSVVDKNDLVSSYVSTVVVIKELTTCDESYVEGEEGLTFTQVDLGTESGIAYIYYDTYSVPDRIDVFQGNTWLAGTGSNPGSVIPPLCNCSAPLPGFVGESGVLEINYNPSKGRIITVVVSGCLGSNTLWIWELSCPETNK